MVATLQNTSLNLALPSPLFPTAYRLGIQWPLVVSTESVLVLAVLTRLASIG